MKVSRATSGRPRKFATLFCVLLLLLLIVSYFVSREWCISYASGDFFFVLTDGYFVIPWSDGRPRTWDDWGWWVQKPWDEYLWNPWFFYFRETRQIGGQGLHVSLDFLIMLTVFWITVRHVEKKTHRQTLVIAIIGWFLYTAGAYVYSEPSWLRGDLANLAGRIGAIIAIPSSLIAIKHFVRSRKIAPGFCQKCRYNLFGNTTGRCPECGTPIPETALTHQASVPPDDLDAAQSPR